MSAQLKLKIYNTVYEVHGADDMSNVQEGLHRL